MLEFIRQVLAEGGLPCTYRLDPTEYGNEVVFKWYRYHNSKHTSEARFWNVTPEENRQVTCLWRACVKEGVYKIG